jgi:hypothetical protein
MEELEKIKTTIGIDPGTNTGIATIEDGEFKVIQTTSIHRALLLVYMIHKENIIEEVVIEDPRNIGWSGPNAAAKAQGAGSIKRDANIWESFLTDYKIPFRFVRPSKKSLTKKDSDWFKLQTGWQERTSNHARDAACLILHKLKTK